MNTYCITSFLNAGGRFEEESLLRLHLVEHNAGDRRLAASVYKLAVYRTSWNGRYTFAGPSRAI